METQPKPVFRKTADTFRPGVKTLPQSYFISPEVYAKEQERIFSTQWLCAGHQSQLSAPGDYFLQDVAGESLILLRDPKRETRGVFHIFRPRGKPVWQESRGHLRETIQCPYHAWTYALDGRLVGAPHMDKVEGFAKAEHSLHSLRLALWEGFIFVNLAAEPAPLES